jgi:hypothetical protein
VKQQLTPQDTVLLSPNMRTIRPATISKPDPAQARPLSNLRNARSNPRRRLSTRMVARHSHAAAGWTAGERTEILRPASAAAALLIENPAGAVVATDTQPFDVRLTDDLEIYTAEVNQIFSGRNSAWWLALWQRGLISPIPFQFALPFSALRRGLLRAIRAGYRLRLPDGGAS